MVAGKRDGELLGGLLQDRSNKEVFKRGESLSSLPQFGFKRPVNRASAAAGMPVSESTTDETTRLMEESGPNRRNKKRSSAMPCMMRREKRGASDVPGESRVAVVTLRCHKVDTVRGSRVQMRQRPIESSALKL